MLDAIKGTTVLVVVVMLVLLNAFVFRFVGDIVTSLLLVAIGYAAGRWWK